MHQPSNFASARCARVASEDVAENDDSDCFASARCARVASRAAGEISCLDQPLPRRAARGLRLYMPVAPAYGGGFASARCARVASVPLAKTLEPTHDFASARCARVASNYNSQKAQALFLCLGALRAGCVHLLPLLVSTIFSLPRRAARGLRRQKCPNEDAIIVHGAVSR